MEAWLTESVEFDFLHVVVLIDLQTVDGLVDCVQTVRCPALRNWVSVRQLLLLLLNVFFDFFVDFYLHLRLFVLFILVGVRALLTLNSFVCFQTSFVVIIAFTQARSRGSTIFLKAVLRLGTIFFLCSQQLHQERHRCAVP
jgi:hypothetical protein